jgi:hypothetical protein
MPRACSFTFDAKFLPSPLLKTALGFLLPSFFGQQPLVPFPPPQSSIFSIIPFLSATLLTKMTGSSLHMQWPLTSQSHGSFLKENNCFFS